MSQRFGFAAASLLLTVTVVLALSSGSFAGPGTRTPKASAFPHSSYHVPSIWLNLNEPERMRDCQGCHDYYRSPEPKDTGNDCYVCHTVATDGTRILTFSGTIDSQRRANAEFPDLFKHFDHKGVECRACHLPEGGLRSVPNEMPIPKGLGWCVKCHDDTFDLQSAPDRRLKPGQDLAKRGDPRGVQASLNASPNMRPKSPVAFSHEDHIPKGRLNDPRACDDCHASMTTATAEFGEKVVDAKGCKLCHVSDPPANTPDDFFSVVKARPRASLSDGTFFHKDHLTQAALNHPDYAGKGCLACHEFQSPDQVRGEFATYDFAAKFEGFKSYDACMSCHYHSKDKAERFFVPDHAQVAKFSCNSCHAFDSGPMVSNRPMVETNRQRPTTFGIQVQAHPHITTSPGSGIAAECAKCHKVETPTVPSRLTNRRFDHRPHLSAQPTTDECRACHAIDSSGMIQQALAGGVVTYDGEKCNACHRDENKVTAAAMPGFSARAPLFPHERHVGKQGVDGRAMECATCHELLSSPIGDGAHARDFGFKAGVQDCRSCHNHGNYAQFTGGKDAAYVNTCGSCHRSSTNPAECDIPAPGSAIPIARSLIVGTTKAQFHPLPSDQACGKCHTALLPSSSREMLAVTYERPPVRNTFHQMPGNELTPRQLCVDCHWGQTGESNKTKLQQRTEPEIRNNYGGNLDNYPGGRR